MPIYTDDPGKGINQPIGNVPSGLGESLLASLEQGFDEGPINSFLRLSDSDHLVNDPDSKIVSKQEADARLAEYGVKSINIPDNGVTQSFLDHVVDERRQSLAKQQIARAAPSEWYATPLNFTASLAGSMADPGNIALAFIPFAGEAKAASMLGRIGERFVSGAKMGALQAIATVPLTAEAAAAEGDDFTYGNALESTFFNTLAGGLMHAGGGLIADAVRARRASSVVEPESATAVDSQPSPGNTPDNIPPGVNIPDAGTNADLSAAIARDAESYAYSRAYNEVVPDYLARQQEIQTGEATKVAELRTELNGENSDPFDVSLSQNTAKDIRGEKDGINTRNNEINQSIAQNDAVVKARGLDSPFNRIEIPDELAGLIDQRASQIRNSMQMSPVARAMRTAISSIREADWSINQQAYRAALAHMMEGRAPDVESFYDLHQPALRERAIQRIQNPIATPDEAGLAVSESADRVWQDTQKTDHELTSATTDLENEFNISEALLNDIATEDPDIAHSIRENLAEIRQEANDSSLGKAFRAFAACMINRGL